MPFRGKLTPCAAYNATKARRREVSRRLSVSLRVSAALSFRSEKSRTWSGI
ncbi:Uncharacterized protein dnm_074370 [Desulfonema magnum]|uniref:Uncharacterized protein n=1 Tax=Desulfonema magnum TaxID=45655 RepID=A0A975BU54_9BACT|nr:Uncharacterized protein dnm_074370 [Desulfonema magnum]